MSTAIKTSVFSFVGVLNDLFIYSIDTAWLVDHVEGFGPSSLATLPLGSNYGFTSTSRCGSATGVCSWGCPGGPGSAPVRARCEGGAAGWVAGVLAAPGTQGSWWLGLQEIQCYRRGWQPVLANMLQYSCLEKPPPWQRSLAGHRLEGCKESGTTKVTLCS